ncbi:hypothetical protein NLJ89_g3271 [Agrocybe chaxingu]|uniref:Cytochrome P450 n=1 Tax=Agrocybe chaxingu TaxID=84603 RepID=A0A9W8KBA3_9AGAR|nr:hypothetical protein NLJ89_g3271 [Agrocybe chaxingu]
MAFSLLDSCLAALALVLLLASLSRKKRPVPPGPRGLPVLGNLFDIPKKESWQVYLDWGKQYNSEILYMNAGGKPMFILNSIKVIQDLLVRRSNIYSDRPRSTMLDELIGTSWLMPFMNKDNKWKGRVNHPPQASVCSFFGLEHRQLFRREFDNLAGSTANKNHEVQAARRLLQRLLTSSDHEGELRLASVDVILSITYGITPTNFEHPFITTPEQINEIFADVARGGYLVDAFPFLKYLPKWFPGVKFHETGERGKALAIDLLMGPYKEVKSQVENGTAVSSVASRFLYAVQEGADTSEGEIDAMRSVMANAYLGGADTTVCALYNFTTAMALYPHVQKKAQKVLDDLLSGQRLPEFSDFGSVPYLAAVVNEVLRWHPVTPFAIYHASNQDDTYNGYFIPKGSYMIANSWAILRDESIFGPDTDKFIPERFMKDDANAPGPDLSDVDLAFGFGRRACPGRLMARDTLWVMAAHILTAYDITDPVDKDGNKLTADSPMEWSNAMVSFPPHLRVTFKRRIPESMIQDALLT